MDVLSKPLSGSSSSSSNQVYEYDVFLSFRGPDTRLGFTDHLYNALLDADIKTFLDDEEIETGTPLKPSLKNAIKSSKASIVVLSKDYASSTWCLEELVLILEQHPDQNVIPIFYHVEPTDVRKQTSSFGEAMAKKHKERMEAETNEDKRKEWTQKMDLWKRALTQVADLKGINAKNRKETELLKEVVTCLRRSGVPSSNTLPFLIGMEDYVQSISSWLTDGSSHRGDILTVVGMGGAGKTSLAKYVFMKHSKKFPESSFIEGINKKCNDPHTNGLLDLQKKLYGDISKKFPLQGYDVPGYTCKIKEALACRKVFIVLDDIGSFNQLNALLGNIVLHPGSKIIITTKYASLTERCALFDTPFKPKHSKVLVKGLCETKSLELFCFHAFKNHKPKEGYEEVSEKVVKYCDGHPLALVVLGGSLHKRSVAYWEDLIKVLKKEFHSRINQALKTSFDSLEFENDKDLFKHIACYFVRTNRDVTETILNACDINTISGFTNLIDRCLLRIGLYNELEMHSLFQKMGRDLVRKEYPKKLWKRSRLWCHEESLEVLKKEKGTGKIVGLALDMKMLDGEKSFELKTESLSKMCNLMLLQLNNVQLSGSYKNFPQNIRWLCMHGFPSKSIPSDLPTENLVVLNLSYSSIESFGTPDGNPQPPVNGQNLYGSCSKYKRFLGSLKILDLSFCEQLHSVGGFLELPALERLILRNCIRLVEVCESVEQCVQLCYVDMCYCYKLRRFPTSTGRLKNVKTILLDGCTFGESQTELWDMKSLDMSSINSQLPICIE